MKQSSIPNSSSSSLSLLSVWPLQSLIHLHHQFLIFKLHLHIQSLFTCCNSSLSLTPAHTQKLNRRTQVQDYKCSIRASVQLGLLFREWQRSIDCGGTGASGTRGESDQSNVYVQELLSLVNHVVAKSGGKPYTYELFVELKIVALGDTDPRVIIWYLACVLNQMGLACVQLFKIGEAAELFKEARGLLEQECGPCHQDTLGVYSNLAATYDAMGSQNVTSQRWWVFYWQVSFSSEHAWDKDLPDHFHFHCSQTLRSMQ